MIPRNDLVHPAHQQIEDQELLASKRNFSSISAQSMLRAVKHKRADDDVVVGCIMAATAYSADRTLTGPFPYFELIALTTPTTGQFVRMRATARGSIYGNSLWEMEVYSAP